MELSSQRAEWPVPALFQGSELGRSGVELLEKGDRPGRLQLLSNAPSVALAMPAPTNTTSVLTTGCRHENSPFPRGYPHIVPHGATKSSRPPTRLGNQAHRRTCAGLRSATVTDTKDWQPDSELAGWLSMRVFELGADPTASRRSPRPSSAPPSDRVPPRAPCSMSTASPGLLLPRAPRRVLRPQGYHFYALDLRKCGRSRRAGQTAHYVSDLSFYDVG